MTEIVCSVAANLIEVLGREAIKKTCDTWGYQSQLEELKETISTVEKVLLDADSKWDKLSHQDRDFINKLKDVVYDADDVFDEFQTLAELNQLGKLKKGGKYFDKVRRFFSFDQNQVGQAYRMSRQVKDIKKRLDAISANHTKFELKLDYTPISRRREETCSYVDANCIIGREDDKEKIINMLLDSTPSEKISFAAIVGMGGLGKTTLVQLVFNDDRIKQEFSTRLWICVSDQDSEFDVKTILCQIIELLTDVRVDGTSTKESVQIKFQDIIKRKKYFLVLDDIWNEDRKKWLHLKEFLMLGQGGSKVVVTTRSKRTAIVIGDGDDHSYMLQGLSNEDSWRLFALSAFASGPEMNNDHKFLEIGKIIVEKCCCIPLAIKVVGSLLFGQDIRKWHSVAENGLGKIGNGENEIVFILKFSYHNLEPSLKSCFSYCAIFPKDFRIEKEKIIDLWLAQGYVIPFDGGQNLEDAAEEHFSILLRRCFFQDVKKDENGDVKSIKIHDLMHDVAQEVGNEEICIVTSTTNKFGDKIRHVFVSGRSLEISLCNMKIRSFFGCEPFVEAKLKNWMWLRVLDLSKSRVENLPNSICELVHLRYLDLSHSSFYVLCESITKLYNLQTLDLYHCMNLRNLPEGISKMVNLRHLDLQHCIGLTCMPSGMYKLTNLRVLPLFVMGSWLVDKCAKQQAVLENVEPESYPISAKELILKGYEGKRIGRVIYNWDISFPLLVKIQIWHCKNLEQMPVLSKLPNLKLLQLGWLYSVEYIEKETSSSSDTEAAIEFFPSLESFVIQYLPKWKAWWEGDFQGMSRLACPHLSVLKIECCPNLISFPLGSPALRNLHIEGCNYLKGLSMLKHLSALEELRLISNENLSICEEDDEEPWKSLHQSLRQLEFSNLPKMRSLPKGMHHLTLLQSLDLFRCENMEEGLPEWINCLSSLQFLWIEECPGIKSLPEAIKDLTSFKKLHINKCPNLENRCKEPNGEDFPKIQHISQASIGNEYHVDKE